jgi:transposase
MSIGKQNNTQGNIWIAYDQIPKGQGHAFYDQVQRILRQGKFDTFIEDLCGPYYAPTMGRPSIPLGRYFRMLLVGYFEGIDSERGICWRCADSLSLREFLQLDIQESVPDHSSLSRIRSRLPLETHHEMFVFVLKLLVQQGIIKGKRLGIDASTMEANAAMRSIVRRDTGESYNTMLERLAVESGSQTPTKEELIRFDRQRKGKTCSNKDWGSLVDKDARIAKLKDGRTHLAYKPEHVVDIDSGAIISARIHLADKGDTATLLATLFDTRKKLKLVLKAAAPKYDHPAELVADKGYHSRELLKNLDSGFRSRISEPKPNSLRNWKGDHEARRAVYNNRIRVVSVKGKALLRKRGEFVERSFAHCLDRGGMRRVHLRGEENIEKRYILHIAAFNIGILVRALFGFGTPRGLAGASHLLIMMSITENICLVLLFAGAENGWHLCSLGCAHGRR